MVSGLVAARNRTDRPDQMRRPEGLSRASWGEFNRAAPAASDRPDRIRRLGLLSRASWGEFRDAAAGFWTPSPQTIVPSAADAVMRG
jgi:hypothetical protein